MLNYIANYMLESKRLKKDLDRLNSYRLYENNIYKKDINKLYETLIFKCNEKEFMFREEDRYNQGMFNGIEHNVGTLKKRYQELGSIGCIEIFLAENRCDGLTFSYRWGYCSKIDDIFTIRINGGLIYLSNSCEEQYIVDDNHKIFEIIKSIDKECKLRLKTINDIIGESFYEFKRKVLNEEDRIYKIEQEKDIEEYINGSLEKYINS